MQTYVYQNNAELTMIDQALLPVMSLQDPIFELFPVRTHDAAHVLWEQYDDFTGLMQIRGYNAEFPMVQTVGLNRYNVPVGVYGEGAPITEQEITERRAPGDFSRPIDLSDLVRNRHLMLMTRQWNRMSQILWTLLGTGTYAITNVVTGAIGVMDAFVPQSYTAGTTWATTTTAAPLADLRAITLLHRGYSVTFNSMATAWMNLKTFNNLIANSNTADLGGRRSTGLETVEGLGQFNTLATKDGLPNIRIWDEGYKSDGITDTHTAGSFQLFIPDNTVIVTGKRLNGKPIGEFQLTRNAQNPDVGPGYMVRVVDTGANENHRPPRQIEVFRGFNGGPSVQYASAIVLATM